MLATAPQYGGATTQSHGHANPDVHRRSVPLTVVAPPVPPAVGVAAPAVAVVPGGTEKRLVAARESNDTYQIRILQEVRKAEAAGTAHFESKKSCSGLRVASWLSAIKRRTCHLAMRNQSGFNESHNPLVPRQPRLRSCEASDSRGGPPRTLQSVQTVFFQPNGTLAQGSDQLAASFSARGAVVAWANLSAKLFDTPDCVRVPMSDVCPTTKMEGTLCLPIEPLCPWHELDISQEVRYVWYVNARSIIYRPELRLRCDTPGRHRRGHQQPTRRWYIDVGANVYWSSIGQWFMKKYPDAASFKVSA